MKLRVGTFNVENLFARFRFQNDVAPEEVLVDGWAADKTKFISFSQDRRTTTAMALAAMQGDIVGLQEVESLDTLRRFLREFRQRFQGLDYPYQLLIDGFDHRLIDVAVISRYPIDCIRTHQFDRTDKGEFIYTRDCLEVDFRLPTGKILPFYVSHFKSMDGGRDYTMHKRRIQATRVVEILQERFGPDPGAADWIVVGDFNDYMPSDGLASLLEQPWLENVVERLPPNDRWTHYYARGDEYRQFDYILLSRALAEKNPNALPTIERRGMPKRATKCCDDRFPGIGHRYPKASDHCPVVIEIDV
jgi:endonuclease/exonuclease/phosphatase family metal-dependent hydrolase